MFKGIPGTGQREELLEQIYEAIRNHSCIALEFYGHVFRISQATIFSAEMEFM
jgi:hypothetical protein